MNAAAFDYLAPRSLDECTGADPSAELPAVAVACDASIQIQGLLTTAHALLEATPDPTPDDAYHAISGNLCRCTGYIPIVEAILDAARRLRAGTTA
jgi:hypothetical protein